MGRGSYVTIKKIKIKKISRIFAAAASGGGPFHSSMVLGMNENCLYCVRRSLWLLELLVEASTLPTISTGAAVVCWEVLYCGSWLFTFHTDDADATFSSLSRMYLEFHPDEATRFPLCPE